MRATTTLTSKLERNLIAYVTAASAAGVGMLVPVQSAQAKVIYRSADILFGLNGYKLDVNEDGITDLVFTVSESCEYSWCAGFAYVAGQSAAIRASRGYAAALRRGARIGPNKYFYPRPTRLIEVLWFSNGTDFGGPWADWKKHYLGFRFKVNSQTHYGWARLRMTVQNFYIYGKVTGYAYETIPDKPIIAGNRGSTTGAGPQAEPFSLGRMALGAAGRRQHQPSRAYSH